MIIFTVKDINNRVIAEGASDEVCDEPFNSSWKDLFIDAASVLEQVWFEKGQRLDRFSNSFWKMTEFTVIGRNKVDVKNIKEMSFYLTMSANNFVVETNYIKCKVKK